MNDQQAATNTRESTRNTSDTRLHGPWLVMSWIGWVILTLINLLIFVFAIPAYAAQLHSICTADCNPGQVTPGNALALTHLGIPLDVYIAYILTITLLTSLVYLTVGAIIFWRKSQELIGLLVSLLLIAFGCCGGTLELVNALSATHPDWIVVQFISQAAYIIYPALGVFFCLFPDGHFVPRWSWMLIGLWILSVFPFAAPSDSPFSIEKLPPVLLAVLFLLTWGISLGFQIYRYRYVSRHEQRQQTKWLVFAGSISIGCVILYFALQGLVPAFNQPDSLYQLAYATVTFFVFLFIPLALGIAILRYRLWDIDVLIRRTLVYATLTVILALLYFGLIFALQFLFQGFFRQNNAVAIVVSTLLIYALFWPLRRRIQNIIDRRFYRRKYDAAKIVEAFSTTLRNEVDLNQLRQHLLTVVQDTMQPQHISLWLREPESSPPRPELMPPE